MSNMNPFIKIDNLSVGYNSRSIIDAINFEAEAGEIVTLIGANGCGKSTILKTIAGLIPVVSGNIYINAKPLSDIPSGEAAKLRAVMLTDSHISEKVSARQLASYGRYPYTGFFGKLSREDERKIEESLMRTGCNDFADNDFDTLSDGQKQRVYLARAIAQEPSLMLLDEPTTFLDVKYKLEFLTLIKELSIRDKITIIMSLHELDMVEQVSDKIVAIKNGGIDKIAGPDVIFTKGYINELYDIELGSFDEDSMRGIIKNGA